MPIRSFLDRLASAAPTPGGGSAAALVGASAAALLSMVTRLAIAKRDGPPPGAEELLTTTEALRADLFAAVERDADAFNAVMAAYRMPRSTDAEQKARHGAIQRGLMHAAQVPLEVARSAGRTVDTCILAAGLCPRSAASDLRVAAHLARAAVLSASENVTINCASMSDRAAAASTAKDAERIVAEAETSYRRALCSIDD